MRNLPKSWDIKKLIKDNDEHLNNKVCKNCKVGTIKKYRHGFEKCTVCGFTRQIKKEK